MKEIEPWDESVVSKGRPLELSPPAKTISYIANNSGAKQYIYINYTSTYGSYGVAKHQNLVTIVGEVLK